MRKVSRTAVCPVATVGRKMAASSAWWRPAAVPLRLLEKQRVWGKETGPGWWAPAPLPPVFLPPPPHPEGWEIKSVTSLSWRGGRLNELLASAEMEPCAAAAADLWHALKGVRSGERGTLCSMETGCVQELISWSQPLNLLLSRKALKPFMVTSAPRASRKPFVKWELDGFELPLHQNLTYWPCPSTSLQQFLSYLRCCLPVYSPHFAPNKT